MAYRTLITAEQLRALEPRPVLLDCSFDLADSGAGERGFAVARIPGAAYAHLDRDLAGARTGLNGRHPLPEMHGFARRVGAWGITPDMQVVTYDAQGGPYAARAWWLLRWLGHSDVAVLDGGLAAWQAAGGPLTSDSAGHAEAAPYPVHGEAMPTVGADDLLAGAGQWHLIDARAGERFRGEVEPLDRVAGHIPGAINRVFKNNLQADGRFKPAAQLRVEFDVLGLPSDKVVHQCGSGVTACHNLLAMTHAGLEGSRLYPGSWSEWSSDPARPVARG
jgi:thiosulfate/3-mercaptopyruvate sulfurtransferase